MWNVQLCITPPRRGTPTVAMATPLFVSQRCDPVFSHFTSQLAMKAKLSSWHVSWSALSVCAQVANALYGSNSGTCGKQEKDEL